MVAPIRLGREAEASTRATTSKYLTAIFGCHASTEAVVALALQNAGLKSALHTSAFNLMRLTKGAEL